MNFTRDLCRPSKLISLPWCSMCSWNKGRKTNKTSANVQRFIINNILRAPWSLCIYDLNLHEKGDGDWGGVNESYTAAVYVMRRGRTDAHCSLEKLLTSRRNSPAPSSFLHSGRRPQRSAVGPGSHFDRWRRRHPACGSPEESNPPFPGSPSLRCNRQSVFPYEDREGFIPSFLLLSLLATPRVQRVFGLRTHRFNFRCTPSLTAPPWCVSSPQL